MVAFALGTEAERVAVAPTLTARDRTLFLKLGYAWLW